VTLDLRGFGQSDRDPKGDYTIPAFAADVAAVAEQLGIPRYVLVGHSMAGHVVAEVAKNYPDRVAGLVFDDPAGDLSKLSAKDLEDWLAGFGPERYDLFREEWFGEMLKTARPEVRTEVMATMRRQRREVVEAAARGLAAYDPKPAMKAYAGPMLAIVVPDNDKPQSLQKLAPSVKVVRVKDASHWIMMDKPEEFNAALEEFLAGIPAK
jgi:pimeloyl-ACP methyl ester carboxylesterase